MKTQIANPKKPKQATPENLGIACFTAFQGETKPPTDKKLLSIDGRLFV